MSTTRRLSAISFDVGYTLIEPIHEANAIVRGLLDELHLDPAPDQLAAAYARAERLFFADYLRPLSDTWEADERILHFYRGYYRQLLNDLGVDHPDEQYAHTIIARYLDPGNWRPYPHVIDTLATLHAQHYKLGIASDWGSGLTRLLHYHGLSRYLDWALVSGMIGHAKPSPQFYRLVVQRADMPAGQIVHIGDSYYADVRGARTVGMNTIMIDWQRRAWPNLDVPLIHDLRELPKLLATFEGP